MRYRLSSRSTNSPPCCAASPRRSTDSPLHTSSRRTRSRARRLFDESEVVALAPGTTRRGARAACRASLKGEPMASIHPYRTSKGERRYRVKYRDGGGRQRARSFTARADAQAFKVDVERRQQAGTLYRVETERFGRTAEAWLERYVAGAAGRVRPRPKSVALVRDGLVTLAPLSDLPIDRIHRPLVEDVIAALAATCAPTGRDGLALLKRILRPRKRAARSSTMRSSPSASRVPTIASRAISPGRRQTRSAPGCPSSSPVSCRSRS